MKRDELYHLINLIIALNTLNNWFPNTTYRHRLGDAVGRLGRLLKKHPELLGEGFELKEIG